jgi:DNA processing protein
LRKAEFFKKSTKIVCLFSEKYIVLPKLKNKTQMKDNSLIYKIALSFIPNLKPDFTERLINYVGGVEAIFNEKRETLLKIPHLRNYISSDISTQNLLKRAEKEIEFIEKRGIQTIFFLDENYPTRLRDCDDAPILLYYKGNANLNHPKILSIVGTRSMTNYGQQMCQQLVKEISQHHPLIVSGLAFGVDGCSHRAALENNLATLAVLAHGFDRIYPCEHTELSEKMLFNGGLLTEYPSFTEMDKNSFKQRNRIVAGLADATIVIESGKKGGSLSTATIANSYGREVFAFSGKATDRYSVGCNELIKNNKAALIQNAQDLEYHLGWDNYQSQRTS